MSFSLFLSLPPESLLSQTRATSLAEAEAARAGRGGVLFDASHTSRTPSQRLRGHTVQVWLVSVVDYHPAGEEEEGGVLLRKKKARLTASSRILSA